MWDDGEIVGEPIIFIYVSQKFTEEDILLPEHVIPDRLECVGIRIEEIDPEGKGIGYRPHNQTLSPLAVHNPGD